MKKWFIKQELPKTDEEHIVVGNDATNDEERYEQSEANSLDSRTQPPPPSPSRLKHDPDQDSGFVYCGQDEPENAPSETEEEYGRKHNVDQDEPARRKQFMRLFVPEAKPSTTPQVCWLLYMHIVYPSVSYQTPTNFPVPRLYYKGLMKGP